MQYGLQLYSVRDITESNLRGALEKVAQLGYNDVEFAGFFGHSGTEVADWLNEYGLTAKGTHTALALLTDHFDEVVACQKAIGAARLFVPYANPKTQAEADALLETLRDLSGRLAKHGITLGYHNHDHEFKPIEGGAGLMERLVNETGLQIELDTYWAYAAGEDAIAWMDRIAALNRLPVVHIKDGFMGGEGMPLGRGTAPVAQVYARAIALGADLVVESETLTPSGMAEAQECIAHLHKLEK